MPKMLCTCGNVLRLSNIPCELEYKFISDVEYDRYEGMVDAEELYMAMKMFFECPECRRLWVFWNGFGEEPTEYIRADQQGPEAFPALASLRQMSSAQMTEDRLTYDGQTIFLPDGSSIEVEHQVQTACLIEDRIVALYSTDEYLFGEFRNLAAYDSKGAKIWAAELPADDDAYALIETTHPLIAYAWSGFECVIDAETGRIINKRWRK